MINDVQSVRLCEMRGRAKPCYRLIHVLLLAFSAREVRFPQDKQEDDWQRQCFEHAIGFASCPPFPQTHVRASIKHIGVGGRGGSCVVAFRPATAQREVQLHRCQCGVGLRQRQFVLAL